MCCDVRVSGASRSHFHLPCYFIEINSARVDEPRYARLNFAKVAGFESLHVFDQDLVRRMDIRNANTH